MPSVLDIEASSSEFAIAQLENAHSTSMPSPSLAVLTLVDVYKHRILFIRQIAKPILCQLLLCANFLQSLPRTRS